MAADFVESGSPVLTEFQLSQSSEAFNKGTATKQIIHEEHNTARNTQPIFDMLEDERALDLSDEPKADGKPFFLIGSGGGLDDSIKYLKDWKGGIFCSTSHATTLMYHGIEPTHIIALDPFSCYDEIAGLDWGKTKTKLCMHPGVWPDLLEKWPNEVLLFRQEAGRPDSFYATTQLHMFTKRSGEDRQDMAFDALIKTSITLFSCAPPAQLFIARQLGYGTCFLAGMNFGYDTGKERFTGYTVKKPAMITEAAGNAPPVEIPIEWEKTEALFFPPGEPGARVRNPRAQDQLCMSHNGIWTDQISIFYKKNFISAWRLSQANIYTTDHGTLDEIPYVDINKVIRTGGRLPERSVKWICQTADRYLARSNNFVVETEPKADGNVGTLFIEARNPEIELPQYMINMRQQCICPVCGLQAVNETDREPGTEPCPRCEEGHFVRKHNIDIGKNMDRVHQLMRWVVKHTPPSTAAPAPLTFADKLKPFEEAMKLNPGLVQVFGEEINRLQVARQPRPVPVPPGAPPTA